MRPGTKIFFFRYTGTEHEIVNHAMILAFELDEFLPASVGASDAQGVEICFAAGVGEAESRAVRLEIKLGVRRRRSEPDIPVGIHKYAVGVRSRPDPERQLRAVQHLQEHDRVTNREYRELCPGISGETARLDMVDLVEKGMLLKIGDKKGTYYMLK